MNMELLMVLARRLRQLSDDDFEMLDAMIQRGEETTDERQMRHILDALADCVEAVQRDERRHDQSPPLRIAT